jgi:hypothetical protein
VLIEPVRQVSGRRRIRPRHIRTRCPVSLGLICLPRPHTTWVSRSRSTGILALIPTRILPAGPLKLSGLTLDLARLTLHRSRLTLQRPRLTLLRPILLLLRTPLRTLPAPRNRTGSRIMPAAMSGTTRSGVLGRHNRRRQAKEQRCQRSRRTHSSRFDRAFHFPYHSWSNTPT